MSKYLDGQDPDMRAAVVSIDPHNGAIRAYYGGTDANGFDFAQAGLQTGSSFKVFALVAALEQGIGLGYQVDSSPLTVDGIKITNVDGESCGTCNIAEALKMSLNTSYYRLMLKLKNGPQAVADAAHQAGIATSFPGVAHTLSEDGKGGPPNNGVVLGQYQTRLIDMASAYATLAASGIYHRPHFVQKVVNAEGQVLFDAGNSDNNGEQRIDKAVADNVTAAMQPIAGYSRGHSLGRRTAVGGQDRHHAVGRHQREQGRLDGRLHAVAVDGGVGGHRPRQRAAGNRFGRRGLRLGPAVRHLEVDDGRRSEGHLQRDLPQADRDRRLRGCARRAAAPAGAAAVGDRHPAHYRSGAGHHHPGWSADDDHRRAAASAGRHPGQSSRAARRGPPPYFQPPP